MAAIILTSGVGNPIATLFVLFVPGYLLVAALFPGKAGVDWIERVALSVGLSIAVVPLLVLLLNFTPWGIRLEPIVVSITLFTVGIGAVAHWRRQRLLPEQPLFATLD